MLNEVGKYGNVLGISGLQDSESIEQSTNSGVSEMLINKDTYDHRDLARRPPGW
jgi:hypothetical protein